MALVFTGFNDSWRKTHSELSDGDFTEMRETREAKDVGIN